MATASRLFTFDIYSSKPAAILLTLISSDLDLCAVVTCPDPGTPLHGSRYCTSSAHAYGSVCSFDCNDGYQLLGATRLICGASGEWLAHPPTCRGSV